MGDHNGGPLQWGAIMATRYNGVGYLTTVRRVLSQPDVGRGAEGRRPVISKQRILITASRATRASRVQGKAVAAAGSMNIDFKNVSFPV